MIILQYGVRVVNPLPRFRPLIRETNDETKTHAMSQEQDIKEIVSLGYDECKAKAAL
jgi:hypothetical protein